MQVFCLGLRCGGRSTIRALSRFPVVAPQQISALRATILYFSTETPPTPPPAVVLALKRVSALRQRCAEMAQILDEAGALPADLAQELDEWKEDPDDSSLAMADAEKEAARLRALSDDLASVLRRAEIMAEHGEHKC